MYFNMCTENKSYCNIRKVQPLVVGPYMFGCVLITTRTRSGIGRRQYQTTTSIRKKTEEIQFKVVRLTNSY